MIRSTLAVPKSKSIDVEGASTDHDAQVDIAVIEVRSLTVRYPGVTALEDVGLRIPRGGVTAVIGPSGCGKSSFLSVLNRMTDLAPGCAVSGRVHVDGSDILAGGVDLIALRRKVGMIFQKPNPFAMSIRRNIELPLRERGVRRRALGGIVERVLRDAGLWGEVRDRLDRSALSLSGGQQQRLCIARALALEPEVILFDEPCSALDPIAGGVVEALVRDLGDRVTVVIVTHNLAQARRIADHVAMFWVRDGSGVLVEAGPAKRVFEAPRDPITAAYLQGSRG